MGSVSDGTGRNGMERDGTEKRDGRSTEGNSPGDVLGVERPGYSTPIAVQPHPFHSGFTREASQIRRSG